MKYFTVRSQMEKRAHNRIKAILAARLSSGDSYYVNCLATIMNISRNGMRVESCKCLPANAEAELLIYNNEQELSVPVKVSRLIKNNGFYDAMGIKVLNPPEEYVKFVENLIATS